MLLVMPCKGLARTSENAIIHRMTEQYNTRNYSENANLVTDTFASAAEWHEYRSRGLIATNNLGLRMLTFSHGPEAAGPMYDALLPDWMQEVLKAAQSRNPDLWEESREAYDTRSRLFREYVDALEAYGLDAEEAKRLHAPLDEASWRDVELRTRIFDLIDADMTPEEAVSLCR